MSTTRRLGTRTGCTPYMGLDGFRLDAVLVKCAGRVEQQSVQVDLCGFSALADGLTGARAVDRLPSGREHKVEERAARLQ